MSEVVLLAKYIFVRINIYPWGFNVLKYLSFETVDFLDANLYLRCETEICISRLASETLDVKLMIVRVIRFSKGDSKSIYCAQVGSQVGHNRTNNFSNYLRFFLENSDFLRLSKIIIILSSKKHGFSKKINVKT